MSFMGLQITKGFPQKWDTLIFVLVKDSLYYINDFRKKNNNMFGNKKQITYCYIYNYFHICVFYDTHGLICLNAWPIGSGTTRRCGLVGEGVALLEEVLRHCGEGP